MTDDAFDELLQGVFSEVRSADKIMTRNLVVASPTDRATEAAKIMIERRISGLPVVDEEGGLVGIVTEKDVLRLLVEVDPDKRVGDYMTRDVKTFDISKSVLDICAHLAIGEFKRVPIVQDGKLVGVVSRRDVIREILRLRGQSE